MGDLEVGIPQGQVDGNLVVDAEEEEINQQRPSIMIRLLVTGAGCMAIWPVTAPNPVVHSRKGVAMLRYLVEDSQNLGIKAQEDEEEVERFVSGASMSYMTRPGMNTRWTMQVNCTSPSDMNPWRPKR